MTKEASNATDTLEAANPPPLLNPLVLQIGGSRKRDLVGERVALAKLAKNGIAAGVWEVGNPNDARELAGGEHDGVAGLQATEWGGGEKHKIKQIFIFMSTQNPKINPTSQLLYVLSCQPIT